MQIFCMVVSFLRKYSVPDLVERSRRPIGSSGTLK